MTQKSLEQMTAPELCEEFISNNDWCTVPEMKYGLKICDDLLSCWTTILTMRTTKNKPADYLKAREVNLPSEEAIFEIQLDKMRAIIKEQRDKQMSNG